MTRQSVFLAVLITLLACFLNCQTGVSSHTQDASAEPTPTSLAEELERAISVLNRGLKENWGTRDQYLAAFEKTPTTDSAGRPMRVAKEYVECLMSARLRVHRIWDEGGPISVEVKRAIVDFRELRNEAEKAEEAHVAAFRPPPCTLASGRRVVLSAAVAASLLKKRVEPVYPAASLQANLSGTVVLQTLIGAEGRVESVRVISGPSLLQKAAVDAVRQWIYRPYVLNNTPVKFETTVNVIFAPGR